MHIIGYQVKDAKGAMYNQRPANEVLSQASAMTLMQEARQSQPNSTFSLVAVLDGDIESPDIEHSLLSMGDTYSVLAVNTEHLDFHDRDCLLKIENDPNHEHRQHVASSETGFFITVDEPVQFTHDKFSDICELYEFSYSLKNILRKAKAAGFHVVEFNAEA